MSMSISYEETGRTNQKARTRNALIEAARALMAEGATPTVEQAAAATAIARATAYRYFPNQNALLIAALPELAEPSLLGEITPRDVRSRLGIVVEAISRMALDHEPELRNMLRLSLESDPDVKAEMPFRKGRRITWVAEALAPLRDTLPRSDYDRLTYAIAASVGIDSLVWLTDIAGLSRDEAVDVMRWTSSALLEAALAD